MNKSGALILMIAALLGLSGMFLAEEEENSQALRCEMFQIWADSKGKYGWPPESNPAAAEQCNQTEVASK